MVRLKRATIAWGIKWRQKNKLDGVTEYIMGSGSILPRCFRIREDARSFVAENYSYIAKRPDLKAEPHGWKIPQVVRMKITVDIQ